MSFPNLPAHKLATSEAHWREEPLGSHLTSTYPPAITDFYGSGSPCIYKTGSAWPVAKGPGSQKSIRASRPIHNHSIRPIWRNVLWDIVALLDSLGVEWSTVDPLAYANAGEATLICDFIITIGVKPHSLSHRAAEAAANAVANILQAAGFPQIEVAFIESIYRLQANLMGFKALRWEPIQGLRKPFTPTLGLSISPHKSPHCEGTGGLFFRLNTDKSDNRVVLLTCAHVARPDVLRLNRQYTRQNESQPREDIILLGDKSFTSATEDIVKFEINHMKAISSWERSLSKVPPQEEGEPDEVSSTRQYWTHRIADTKKMIAAAKDIHSYATKNLAPAASRILGSVLHCSEIEVDADGFRCDWAFIEVDGHRLEAKDFQRNNLFVGGNKTSVDWENFMFPQHHDRRDFQVPQDSLLQLRGYVSEAEFQNPQNYDVHDMQALLAVKNGSTTGTTFGRVNGLESVTRCYPEVEGVAAVAQTALEFVVCGYDTKTAKNDRFSDGGDSGAIVAGRDGRIIGQVTGGAGLADGTDKTYITPYFALKNAIERRYPSAYPLPAAI